MTENVAEATPAPAQEANTYDGFNPFNEPVKQRNYTKEIVKATIGEVQEGEKEHRTPEPTYDAPSFDETTEKESISSQPNAGGTPPPPPPEEPNLFNQDNASNSSSGTDSTYTANPSLEDLPEKEKRKAARKTADVILTNYQNLFPIPFQKLASYNMRKMRKLDMAGEIALAMPVQEDGTTVEQYMNYFNGEVQKNLTVTDDMKNDLKDPLVDCLMENDLALTPTQRLMIAFGGQALQMTANSLELMAAKRDAIDTFKQFKADDDAAGRTQPPRTPTEPIPQTQATPTPEEQVYSAPPDDDEAVIIEENYDAPDFGLDDYLSGKVQEDIASEENGQITVEEIPNE